MKKLLSLLLLLSFTIKAQDVTIGTQTWTSKNLEVTKYRNGEEIPQVKNKKNWANLTTGAWCYYENKTANGTTYGKLYNWFAVNDPRGLAPKGYHIPTDAEWTILTDYLGGDTIAGTKMKSTSGWDNNGNGTNTSGFAGLPGGYRKSLIRKSRNGLIRKSRIRRIRKKFNGIGDFGYWWSSSEDGADSAWCRNLNDNVNRYDRRKRDGFSVRCLRD